MSVVCLVKGHKWRLKCDYSDKKIERHVIRYCERCGKTIDPW